MIKRKPEWLKTKRLGDRKTREITKELRKLGLNTVCEDALCPNRGECFGKGTATFMILGSNCTRSCRFCSVEKEKTFLPPDPDEPVKIAMFANELKLKHVVITTVTRDDLPDGGASQFVKVINEIRNKCGNETTIEVLISDLQGDQAALKSILDAKPDILNHNVETIHRLYPDVRPEADYTRSLELLKFSAEYSKDYRTKSGFMVGLGETKEEVVSLLKDLYDHKVNVVTIGQYMQPTKAHIPVQEYVHPDIFKYYHEIGMEMGFMAVESGPLVRSSYLAEKTMKEIRKISL